TRVIKINLPTLSSEPIIAAGIIRQIDRRKTCLMFIFSSRIKAEGMIIAIGKILFLDNIPKENTIAILIRCNHLFFEKYFPANKPVQTTNKKAKISSLFFKLFTTSV